MTTMESEPLNYNHGFASEYDSLVRETESYGAQIMFGLLFEYVKKGDILLDLGIGTGLSSLPFYQIGLKIYGIDISEDMLAICRKRKIAENLKIHNLNDRLPYDNQFDHIISVGVFHFFRNLEHFFEESRRLLKKGGTFNFTVESPKDVVGISKRFFEGIAVYQHGHQHVKELMRKYDFELLKEQAFQSYNDPSKTLVITSRIFISRKH